MIGSPVERTRVAHGAMRTMLGQVGSTLSLEAISLYLRRAPGSFGRWRLLNWAMPRSRAVLPRNRSRTIRTRHGFRIKVNLGDWLGRHVFVMGDYEPGTARLIRSLLKPGDFFVDVGANVGFFTLLGARCVGSSGLVISFEPLHEVRGVLEQNIRLNRLSNVIVRAEAGSDSASSMPYYSARPDHLGCSSLRRLDEASAVSEVCTVRLDDVLPQNRRVRLLKIDVEGAELRVLEGMRERLVSDRPDIVVEITDSYLRGLGDSEEELIQYLRQMGYLMYLIGEGGLIEIDVERPAVAPQYNAFFTTASPESSR